MKIAIINGPNINMLEYREKDIYGDYSYHDIEQVFMESADVNDELSFFQSNHEGEIIDYIHELVLDKVDALIINPAAYTHYSYAIYDALLIFKGIKVEVHLSDINSRDEFRRISITGKACDKIISGLQIDSYREALKYIYTKK